MKKLITVVLIGSILGACIKEKTVPKRMQASDLASPHVHHGTKSDFVIEDYLSGECEFPAGIDLFFGPTVTGTL